MTATQIEQPLIPRANDPKIKEAVARLSTLHKEKKYQEGWQYANDLLKQYPDNTEIMGFMILLTKAIGKNSLALGFGLSQLHKHPNNFYITYQLGMLCYYNHLFDPAFIFIKKALAMDPNNFLIGGNLAILYFEHGDFDLAISTYQHQLDIKTTDPSMGFGQALAWLAKREYALGWEAFERRFLLKDLIVALLSYIRPYGTVLLIFTVNVY